MANEKKSYETLQQENAMLRQRIAHLEQTIQHLTHQFSEATGRLPHVEQVHSSPYVHQPHEEDVASISYQKLFEQLPIPIVIFCTDGYAVAMNNTNEEFIQTPKETVIGHYNIFEDPEAIQKGYLAHFKRALQGGIARMPPTCYDTSHTNLTGRTQDKHVWSETTYFPLQDDQGTIRYIVEASLDVTHHKQIEQALIRSEERYRVISELVSDFAYAARIKPNGVPVMEWMTDALLHITGYTIEEIETNGGLFSLVHAEDVHQVAASVQHVLDGHTDVSDFRIMTKKGRTRWLRAHAKPIFDSYENRVVYLYGAAQDITERVQHEHEREAIIAVAAALRTASNRAEMIPILLNQINTLLQASGTALVICHAETKETMVEVGLGCWEHMTQKRLPTETAMCQHIIATGQPFLTNNAQEEIAHISLDVGTQQAIACVPLIAQEQTTGILCVGCANAITDEEMNLLSAICDMAANALHRIILHEQTERRLQQLRALHDIDQAITTSLDISQTLSMLLDHVTIQLSIDACDVLLYNSVSKELEYAAGRGFHTATIESTRIPLGEGYAGRSAQERRSIIIPDTRQMPMKSNLAAMFQTENIIAYYGIPLIARNQIKGVLELLHRSPFTPSQEWLDFLYALTEQAAIAIDNAEMFAELQRSNDELLLAYDATIEGWARALELRDVETEGHSRRVTEMTMHFAQTMHFSDEELVHIRRGAILHDIGKMAIPDAILLKPGPLTDEEFAVMRQHTVYAYQLLSPIPFLRPSLDIPYCHHERWDGNGYPQGLKGKEIPISARIFAVVDVCDALRSNRPYRKGWSEEQVCSYIQEQAGTHFDPQVVEIFLEYMCCRTTCQNSNVERESYTM